MIGWSAATLQSKMRSGFVSARRWQSPQSRRTSSPSAVTQRLANAGRQAGQPTELMTISTPRDAELG